MRCVRRAVVVTSKRETRTGCPTASLQARLRLRGVDTGAVLHPGAGSAGRAPRRRRPGCRRGVGAHGGRSRKLNTESSCLCRFLRLLSLGGSIW